MSRESEPIDRIAESPTDEVRRITDEFDNRLNTTLHGGIIGDTIGDSVYPPSIFDILLVTFVGLFRWLYGILMKALKQHITTYRKNHAPYNDVFDPLTTDFDGKTRFKYNQFTDGSDPLWRKFWKELLADIESYNSAIFNMTDIARELKLNSLIVTESSINSCTKAFDTNLRRIKLLVEKGDYGSSEEILALVTEIATENKVYLERVSNFNSTLIKIRDRYFAEKSRERLDDLKAEDDKLKNEIDPSVGSDLELFSEALNGVLFSEASPEPSAVEPEPESTLGLTMTTFKEG